MKNRNITYGCVLYLSAAVVAGCHGTLPVATEPYDCHALAIPTPGPEDLAVDPSDTNTVLIAAVDRRSRETPGALYRLDVSTETLYELQRSDPEGVMFWPHGVDAKAMADGTHLFVVNHDPSSGDPMHSIIEYRVDATTATWVGWYKSELLRSPNDVAVSADGNLYVSNDLLDEPVAALFGAKQEIVALQRASGKNEWVVAVPKIGFPNGLYVEGRTLFATTTRTGKVLAYDLDETGMPGPARQIAEVAGADNLTLRDGRLYTASHPDTWQFLKHARSAEEPSPSVLYAVDIRSGQTKVLYADAGEQLPAASGVAHVGDRLVMATVFAPSVGICTPVPASGSGIDEGGQ